VEVSRYGYVFRHKEPLLCIIGAIAFFWLRFDVNGETWPRFHDGDTNPPELSLCSAQLKAFNKMFSAVDGRLEMSEKLQKELELCDVTVYSVWQ
jgi:hypothetical protein